MEAAKCYDHSAAGAYGTLYINSSTGDYTFVPNDAAIEGLKTTDTPPPKP